MTDFTPEERAERLRESLFGKDADTRHSRISPNKLSGFIAFEIRAAVADETERCAKIATDSLCTCAESLVIVDEIRAPK